MQKELSVSTDKKYQTIDITDKVEKAVSSSGIKEGMAVVYVPHATAAIIVNENWDPNIGDDFLDKLDELIPEGKYRHDKVDGNGAAHIKSALVGPSETIPVKDSKLQLGTWQSVMLCEFDGPKSRRIIVCVQ
ncbi:MAG: secondary thiamine-phosphate synthase enzyme YjbQ [Candidatus Woesearchaeota archaeon]